ncbi:MAG TPA: hypothetical protein VKU19_38305 [Bryobacteraceae bacterium]|nr:hypothetical protein [Bryobacteraceae bacterium]
MFRRSHAQDRSVRQGYGPRLEELGRLGTTTVSAVRVLYSIIYDAPGAWTDAEGHIHHGGGGPGDPVWVKLSPEIRDELIGRAILELSALTSRREAHDAIAKAASTLLKP